MTRVVMMTEMSWQVNEEVSRVITGDVQYHHILFAKKSRRATRKAEAHHTLVAHYIMIVNVRIKTYNTHINLQTFKASIP